MRIIILLGVLYTYTCIYVYLPSKRGILVLTDLRGKRKSMKIPIVPNDPMGTSNLSTKSKCKTCAYHTKSTTDENEMTVAYWHEKPVPHRCHERKNGMVCKGALDKFKELGLEINLDG